METEEARLSFAESVMRCISREIERDVEILKLQKFREVSWALAGDNAEVAPLVGVLAPSSISRPSLLPADRNLPQLLSQLTRGPPELGATEARTLQAAHSSGMNESGGGVAGGRPQVQQDGAVAASSVRAEVSMEPRSTTITIASQTRTGRRSSAPLGESVQRTERARIPSGILRSTHRSAQSRPWETDNLAGSHRRVQRADPVRSISGTRRDNQTYTPIDTQTILRGAGLTRFELTRAEADCASETPDITWSAFTNLFGGRPRDEWMDCDKIPEYKNFFCAMMRAQPFAPTFPGQPGLLLCLPATLSTLLGNNSNTITMLSCSLGCAHLKYLGEYAKRPLPEVQIKWDNLPLTCRNAWIKRLSKSPVPAMRAFRIRVKLRNERNREPSAAEVEQHLFDGSRVEILQRDITSAFRKGEEKILFLGIQCRGYDSILATVIQTNPWDVGGRD